VSLRQPPSGGDIGGPAALDKVVTEDSQRWAKVIKQGGIKVE